MDQNGWDAPAYPLAAADLYIMLREEIQKHIWSLVQIQFLLNTKENMQFEVKFKRRKLQHKTPYKNSKIVATF